jgi:hypothetical protein
VIIRKPDPVRWNFARLSHRRSRRSRALAEAGLADWVCEAHLIVRPHTVRGRRAGPRRENNERDPAACEDPPAVRRRATTARSPSRRSHAKSSLDRGVNAVWALVLCSWSRVRPVDVPGPPSDQGHARTCRTTFVRGEVVVEMSRRELRTESFRASGCQSTQSRPSASVMASNGRARTSS